MIANQDTTSQSSASAPAGRLALGNTYGLTVPSDNLRGKTTNEKKAFDSKKARFLLLASAANLWPESRIKTCFRMVIPGKQSVDIMYNPGQQKSRFCNLVRCGTQACPVCGPWQRLQTGQVWSAMLDDCNYHVAMLTLTIAHHRGENFTDVYNRLKAASRRMWSGRWYKGFKDVYQVVGRLSSLEVTHGAASGYHPHYHIAIFASQPFTTGLTVEMFARLAKRWQDCTIKSGGFASEEHGVDFQAGDKGAIAYLSKLDGTESMARSWGIAQEVTLTDVKKAEKGHRTELQLLTDYAIKGDADAGHSWLEIEMGLKGQTRLKASRGLWELLGGDEHEQRQEAEHEALTESEILLLSVPPVSWREIWRRGLLADLYEQANHNDAGQLRRWLRARGVPLI